MIRQLLAHYMFERIFYKAMVKPQLLSIIYDYIQ